MSRRMTDEAERTRRPSRGAILLSGFVFPGAGQFMQRRWLVGLLFGLGFIVLFCLLLIECVRTILAFYRFGLDQTTPAHLPSILRILALFAACILVYLANVGDAYLAHRRAARRSALQRHFDPQIASLLEQDEPNREESQCPSLSSVRYEAEKKQVAIMR